MKMKKTTKFLLGGALVILFLTPVSQVKADWHRDNIGWWYSLDNGSYYKNADAYINWKSYRFNNSGYMVTGWDYHQFLLNNQKKEGWFYYDPVSGEQQTGWKEINGKWYYLSFGGAYTGIRIIDGKWYYFDPVNCDMKTGWILEKDSNGNSRWYYSDPVSGEMALYWKIIDGKWYYFRSYAATGIQKIDGKWYYFDPVNCDMKTGWILQEDYNGNPSWYYYDPVSGEQLSGWQTIDGKRYYLNASAVHGPAYIDGKYYYFDPVNYDMQTGWVSLEDSNGNSRRYYYDLESGERLLGWQSIDGKRYYFDYFGAYTGRRIVDGKSYYFDSVNGDVKMGLVDTEGRRYYADPDDGGAFATNKTLVIDGVSYTFGADGSSIDSHGAVITYEP